MVLNARIEFETENIPYKVKRRMPTMLQPYFAEEYDWSNFCDSLDKRLVPFEEIKAAWTVLGVVFTVLMLGLIALIVVRFVTIDDEQLGTVLMGSAFAGIFLVFTAYFFLMHMLVAKPLDSMGININHFCEEASAKWETVDFRFQRSGNCTFYWNSDFQIWIDVTTTDPV